MEKNVIWIDENDNVLGEISREKSHAEGLWHRISVVYLTDDSGQILVQKRADGVGAGGRLDHSVAGHVDVNESFLDAAKREMEEELGLSGIDLHELGICRSEEKDQDRMIRHYMKVFQCKAKPVKLDPSEVTEVFWADPRDIWEDMKNDRDNSKYCGGFKATLKLYLKK